MLLPQAHLHVHAVGPGPDTDFIFDVQTTSAGETFQLGCSNNGTYNGIVDWGDGQQDTITAFDAAELTHTYANAGTHEVKCSGTWPAIRFDVGDEDKVYDIKNWGDIGRITIESMCRGMSNLSVSATDDVNLTQISAGARTFQSAGVGVIDLRNWASLSNLTDFRNFFYANASRPIMAGVDISNCVNFSNSYRGSDIDDDHSTLNYSAATTMVNMWTGASSMSSQNADNFLFALWNHRHEVTWSSPTVSITAMDEPSGVYQDPQGIPTTGKEYIYVLENDPDGEGFNTWSITY